MSKEWNFEILSLLFILGICLLMIFPIYYEAGQYFKFYTENIVSIIILLSFTKYIFLLKYTPYAKMKWVKFTAAFLCIPLFLYLINSLFDFQRFLDEEGVASVLLHTQNMDNYNFGKYIKYEFIFVTVGAIVTTILFPIRMIVSIWRVINTKDKV